MTGRLQHNKCLLIMPRCACTARAYVSLPVCVCSSCICSFREFQVQVSASMGIKSCFQLADLQSEASLSSYDSFHLPRRLTPATRDTQE